jgi:hypothetical protein
MTLQDTLYILRIGEGGYDEDYNPTEPQEEWVRFSECFISFNSAAQSIRLNDGNLYVYSYYVIAPLNKERYPNIPKEGGRVRIVKADGTIDRIMEVKGFVTYKKRYMKIWL